MIEKNKIKPKPQTKLFKFSFELSAEEIADFSVEDQKKYWRYYYYYVIKSWIKNLPRRAGLKILPKYKYLSPILEDGNPIGLVSCSGKKIYYGAQYRRLHFFGLIP